MTAVDAVARLFARDFLDFDVKLLVRGTEIPRTRLASNGAGRLGWTTWLSSTATGKSSAVESVVLGRSTLEDLVKEAKEQRLEL